MEFIMRFFFILQLFISSVLWGNIDHAIVGIYAVNAKTGEVLRDENSSKSFVPASCIKAVTTAAALEILGPDFHFETLLEYDGVIENHVLHGNLYIRGGGDPCLGSKRVSSSLPWQQQIEAWTVALQKLGIQKITGKVIGDESRWEKARAVGSWLWEDLGNYYGAGASALSFHENLYALVFRPGKKVGEQTQILRTEPSISSLMLDNEVTTGPVGSGDRACIYGSELSPVQLVRGTVPAGVEEFSIKGAIPNPAVFCAELLAQSLHNRGIQVENQTLSPSSRQSFHTTISPPLHEIIYWTNQKSINLYAEHLLKKIGEAVYREGSTEAGSKAITEFWQSRQIDLEGFNMADGSGLSRKNLITPKQLVAILLHMKKSEHFPQFLKSLPKVKRGIPGKDGAMSLVRGYAGYAGDVVFAILINQCLDGKQMNEKIDRFLLELGPEGSGP
jgi:serine-type D-Ala-D-Ala carboxypeptidase/endopeptidase (penicillin-binding protein 4)